MRSRIIGTGMCVPDRVVTNHDLEKLMDTSDEWIRQRTGVVERRWIVEGESSASMTKKAAKQACERAGIDMSEIDCIIAATLSPDYFFPGNATMIQRELGLSGCATYDVRNQCTGFIYSLALADSFVRSGRYEKVLVVGSELHSTGLDLTTRGRDVSVIFGDGSGVAIVAPSEDEDHGIIDFFLHADGTHAKLLWTDCESSICHPRLTVEMIEDARVYPKMRGRVVFVHALQRFQEAIKEAVEKCGYAVEDVDFFIFHQANLRITEIVLTSLDIPIEKSHNNIDKYGNTTAASIPIALHEAVELGKIKPGDLVCLVAFGSGFTWGSVLMRW